LKRSRSRNYRGNFLILVPGPAVFPRFSRGILPLPLPCKTLLSSSPSPWSKTPDLLSYFLRQIYVFPVLAVMLPFPVVGRCLNTLKTGLRGSSSSPSSKIPDLPLEFRSYIYQCHSYKYISISGFGGHSLISGCAFGIIFFGDTSLCLLW